MKPMIRGNICLNAHPQGCETFTRSWIARVRNVQTHMRDAVKASGKPAPRNVLVIGCSTGYGLASRIVAAFGLGAATVGVSLEREASEKKTGTPGWYNNKAFDAASAEAGLFSATINADAFSNATREEVIRIAKANNILFDEVIYSLASPVRVDPDTGVMYKSVLKPIGQSFTGKTFDVLTGDIHELSIEPATDDEIAATVKVMGGEDWALWIHALHDAGCLAKGVVSLAYSYIGPEHTAAIYRGGAIGRAKEHLEKSAHAISDFLKPMGGAAYVSVNKAVVTRASSVIPVVAMYVAALFKAMKEMGLHEDCLDQLCRLYKDKLFNAHGIPLDAEGRIRIDDYEMRADVQQKTAELLAGITPETIADKTDMLGFKRDFLEAHGFTLNDLEEP